MIQACDDDDDDNGPTGPNGDANLIEVMEDNDDLSEFVSNLENADLTSTLEGNGPLTVFAPNNDAFENIPEDLSDEELNEILTYHIVESDIASGDLESEQTVASQAGSLYVTTENGNVAVNDSASVVEADIEASNGRIHIIDYVLRPDAQSTVMGIIVKRYNLQDFQDAIDQTGLADTLQEDTETGYTVFAPENSAFENADLGEDAESIVEYHILPEELTSENLTAGDVETLSGETVEVVTTNGGVSLVDQNEDTVSVTTTDLQGTNGVVHLTDGVLNAAASDTTDDNGGDGDGE